MDSRLILLDRDPHATDQQWIDLLEAVVQQAKGDMEARKFTHLYCLAVHHTNAYSFKFDDTCDLALQLGKRYERLGQLTKLQALACEAARGDQPFVFDYDFRFKAHAEAVIDLAIKNIATSSEKAELTKALQDSKYREKLADLQTVLHN